jgi:hypothetical protein
MARSFNGSTTVLEAPGFAASCAMRYTVFDAFVWAKFSGGTTNAIIYEEAGSGWIMQLSANDGTSGRLRVYFQDDVTNFQIAFNGSYADSNWHLIRISREATNIHRLYVDNMTTPVASNTSTTMKVLPANSTITRRFGRRASAGGANHLTGDIADYWCYNATIGSSDLTAFVNRTKHPGQVQATDLVSWVSNGTKQPGLDAVHLPNQTFVGSTTATTLVNGPHGSTGPIGLTRSTDLANAWIYDAPATASIMTAAATRTFREPGNVIDRGSTPNRYVFYVTEMSNNYLVMYTSDDLTTAPRLTRVKTRRGRPSC